MVNNSKVGRTKSFGRSVDPSTFVPSEDSNRASSDVHYYNYLLTIEEKPKCFVLEQPVRPSKGKESKGNRHTARSRPRTVQSRSSSMVVVVVGHR